MLKTAIEHTGAKLDGWLAAGAIGVGSLAPNSWLNAYGSNLMIAGGLVLLTVRIAIAIKQFLKE